jgi:hypothetical protein
MGMIWITPAIGEPPAVEIKPVTGEFLRCHHKTGHAWPGGNHHQLMFCPRQAMWVKFQ